VQVTRQDGGVVTGALHQADKDKVVMGVGKKEQAVKRSDIAEVRVLDASKPAEPMPEKAKFQVIEIPEGTELVVRTDTAIASDTSHVEDPIEAQLVNPVTIDGVVALPAGSIVKGVVSGAQPSAKVKGRASLSVRFTSIDVADHGAQYPIEAAFAQEAASTKAKDAKKIGGGAAGGAVIGAIIGGGKGAAIGAAVGGGAGTAVVLSTSGDEVRLPRGTNLTLKLGKSVEARVPIKKN
jgi:hypothetical protein